MPLKAVLIDTNEKVVAPWIMTFDFKVPTQDVTLPTGDCWLATDDATLIVERKTPNDLLASIADGRLFEQAAAMVAQSPWSYVAITGYYTVKMHNIVIERTQTQWDDRSVEGALLTVQDLGCAVIHCDGDSDYGPLLLRLADRDRKEVRVRRRKGKEQSLAEHILNSLNADIGPVRAEPLLKKHKSLARALVALTKLDTDEHTPGIGAGVRQAVRSALELAPDEEMVIGKGPIMSIEIAGGGTILADAQGYEAIAEMALQIQKGKEVTK